MACFPEVSFHAATKTTTVSNETMISLQTMPTWFVTVRAEPSDITSYNEKLLPFFTFFSCSGSIFNKTFHILMYFLVKKSLTTTTMHILYSFSLSFLTFVTILVFPSRSAFRASSGCFVTRIITLTVSTAVIRTINSISTVSTV